MSYTKLGRVRPVYQGEWSAAREYTALDMVRTADGGLTYIAQKNVPAGTPLENGGYWAVVLDVQETLDAAKASAETISRVADTKANPLKAEASGNPVQIYPDEGSLLKPVLTFEPVQTGEGDPYPAGGGKNLIPFENTTKTINGVTFTPQADGRIHVEGTASANATYVLYGEWEVKTGINLKPGYVYSMSTNVGGIFAIGYGYKNGTTYTTIPNGTLTDEYTDTYIYVEVHSGTTIDAYFAPTLTTTGWSSTYIPYSNIRPITGRTGTEMVRCGKNLVYFPDFSAKTVAGITWSCVNGAVSASGTASGNSSTTGAGLIAETTLLDGTYKVLGSSSNISVRAKINENGSAKYYSAGQEFVIGEGKALESVYCQVSSGATVNETAYPMLVFASEMDATFEPYHGDTYTLSFGQTVYGGTLDWNKGEMVVDMLKYECDDSTGISAVAVIGAYTRVGIAVEQFGTYVGGGLFSHGVYKATFADDFPHAYVDKNMVWVFLPSAEVSDAASAKAYLAAQHAAGTPVQVGYKLANPVAIRLAPQQIAALSGVNTVYSDADGMTVNYNKDLTKAFEEVWTQLTAMQTALLNN